MPTEDKGLQTIEEIYGQEPDNEKLAQRVWTDFHEAESARIMKDQTFLDQYKIYRFHPKTRKFPWRSNIYVPMGHVNVLVKVARLVTAILSSDPFFKAVARREEFIPREKSVENLIIDQLEKMEFPVLLHDWALDMNIFSAGFLKMYWKYEEEVDVVERQEQVEVPIVYEGQVVGKKLDVRTVKQETRRVTFDGPCGEIVNVFDFYFDPKATSLKEARYVCHRREVTIDSLVEKAELGIYDMKAVDLIRSQRATTGTTTSHGKASIDVIEHEPETKNDTIEIIEYWTKKKKLVAGPNNILLNPNDKQYPNRTKNSYKRIPFFEIKQLRNAHKFWGIATNEPMASIQDGINDVHNIRFDNWKLTVQQMLVVDESSIRTPTDLVSRPGGIVRVKSGYDTQKAVTALHKGGVPLEAYTEENYLMNLNEYITGVTEPQAGTENFGSGDETATLTRTKTAGVSTRFGVDLILVEPVIKDALNFIHDMNQMFLDIPRVVRVIGPEGYQYPMVGPEDIAGQYDFKFELSPVQGNRELWLQRLMLVFNMLAKVPMVAPGIQWFELTQRLFKAADLRNPNALFIPEVIQMLQQQMMLGMQGQTAMLQAQLSMGIPPGAPMPQGGGSPGEAVAQNPAQGQMNAKMRMPQPTANDMMRDMFAKAS